ncbi:MAG: ScpA family protein [Bacteroidia bacterium]
MDTTPDIQTESEAPKGNTYRVQLDHFEGPFDLLLFFIERDELDIYDIPIAELTNDFLDYIQHMQRMNIELASEFILVASTLCRIKAKMLLPRPELDETGEVIDPREELVRRLLEYKRYKGVLSQLEDLELAQSERAQRGFGKGEEKYFMKDTSLPEEELVGMDLYALMRAFRRVMERHSESLRKPAHVIRRYPYTVDEVKSGILSRVAKTDRVDFVSIVLEQKDRIYAVFCFLSILELIQVQRLALTVGEGYNNFWVSAKTPSE